MIDPRFLATYRRLSGRRDMNLRNADARNSVSTSASLEIEICLGKVESYQNAINDLCDAFHVTEDELRSELTSATTEA
jgi:hypothetical protein